LKHWNIQIQEAQRTASRLNQERCIPMNIMNYQMYETKRILKIAREKQEVTYKGILIRLTADFSEETL
jgi:hypothetical protein